MTSPGTNKPVDLSLMVDRFRVWEEHTHVLMKENKSVKMEFGSALKEIQCCNEKENELQEDIKQLRDTVDDLHATLNLRCDLEDENKKLKEDIEQLRRTIKDIEESRKEKIIELETAAKELEETHQVILAETTALQQEKVLEDEQHYKKILEEKQRTIEDLQKEISELNKKKQAEIIKLTMECDAKLLKMQKQTTKAQQATSQMSSVNQDIFRKKLQYAKAESDKEVLTMKRTIRDLEAKLQAQASKSSANSFSMPAMVKKKRF